MLNIQEFALSKKRKYWLPLVVNISLHCHIHLTVDLCRNAQEMRIERLRVRGVRNAWFKFRAGSFAPVLYACFKTCRK